MKELKNSISHNSNPTQNAGKKYNNGLYTVWIYNNPHDANTKPNNPTGSRPELSGWGGGLFVFAKETTNQLEDCKVLDLFATFCSNGKK
jgi:hypothetical protein